MNRLCFILLVWSALAASGCVSPRQDMSQSARPLQEPPREETQLSDQSRQVTETFLVSPQISIADVAAAAERGVTLIINNRPDGEMIGQPTSADIEAAAQAAGIAYAHIPVDQRGLSEAHLDAFDQAVANTGDGDILAFCRSGTRSITLRAYAAARAGKPADEIIAEAAAAGYDLAGHAPALEAIGASE